MSFLLPSPHRPAEQAVAVERVRRLAIRASGWVPPTAPVQPLDGPSRAPSRQADLGVDARHSRTGRRGRGRHAPRPLPVLPSREHTSGAYVRAALDQDDARAQEARRHDPEVDEGAADEGASDEGAADDGAADEGAADEGAADDARPTDDSAQLDVLPDGAAQLDVPPDGAAPLDTWLDAPPPPCRPHAAVAAAGRPARPRSAGCGRPGGRRPPRLPARRCAAAAQRA